MNRIHNSIVDQYSGYSPPWEMHLVAFGTACSDFDGWDKYVGSSTWWRNSFQCAGIAHVRTDNRSQNWDNRFMRNRDR